MYYLRLIIYSRSSVYYKSDSIQSQFEYKANKKIRR